MAGSPSQGDRSLRNATDPYGSRDSSHHIDGGFSPAPGPYTLNPESLHTTPKQLHARPCVGASESHSFRDLVNFWR